MVAHKHTRQLITLTLFILSFPSLGAQSFDLSDTVTQYPMKGTFYHNKFEGRKTASGEVFNQNLFTAAHKKIKMGTLVQVTNKNTGLSVIVKINDRCPKNYVMDMTRRAAHAIGIRGCQPVTVRILPPGYEKQWERQDAQFDSVPSRLTGNDSTISTNTTNSDKNKGSASKSKKGSGKKGGDSQEKYDIQLGTAHSHGEAFEIISQLPSLYQAKTVLDTTGGSDQIDVILKVSLPMSTVKELNRALKHDFPSAEIIRSE